ncbi:thioester reductase domain-containing protein [Nocardia sp. BMG111209]|uniref:thioester reductase domain-containing protein n=1 Tax=Nocardia sp. BMG111209 TaxID=1160137 RepID=UPI0003765630|nr:thioester reductase domain-containing protein [Nocardia sp. BMG111209]
MTDPNPVRNPSVDRRRRGESFDTATPSLDVAALLARTGDRAPLETINTAPAQPNTAPPPTAPPAAPVSAGDRPSHTDATALAAAITAIANRFTPAPIDADTDFFDGGGTSVAAVEFVAAVSRELHVDLDLDTVFFDARPLRLARRSLTDRADSADEPVSRSADPEPNGSVPVSADTSAAPTPVTAARPITSTSTDAIVDKGSTIGTDAIAGNNAATGTDVIAGGTTAVATDVIAGRDAATSTAAIAGAAAAIGAAATGRITTTSAHPDPDEIALIFEDLAAADRLPLVARPEMIAPQYILLTGATGFLGSHVLLDLLRHSDAHVVCLVRAADDAAAATRLEQAVRGFALPWSREVARRVTAVAGDLRAPRLGLPEQRWEILAAEADSIVNVAAAVDFLRGYPSLRRTNVHGPLNLAELACAGRPKPVHHVSSLAVFNGSDAPTLGEDDPIADVTRLTVGYDRSKWAAETALRRARDHGLTVTMLRPGGIGSHPETGAHNPRDLNAGIAAALLRFRTAPGFRYLNAAPVDWVGRMITEIVLTPSAWGQTYHLTGEPMSLERLIAETTLGGMGVRVQHWEQWCGDVVKAIRDQALSELEPLAQVLQSRVARRQLAAMMTAPPAATTRTAAFAAARGIPAPATGPQARGRMSAALAAVAGPAETPYLQFRETLTGRVTPAGETTEYPCTLRLTLSIANSAQLVTARTVDITGEIDCAALHNGPLPVTGHATVRPHEGIPLRHELRHPLMRYELVLGDPPGRYHLRGHKFAVAGRGPVRQLGTLDIEIDTPATEAAYTGRVAVPTDTYLADQIEGIRVDPRLPERQQRLAKLLWLSWFGGQLGKGLMEPLLRAGIDLLDLRRALTRKEPRR